MNLIEEVKEKKEFSEIPDSVVKRVLEKTEDVKEVRAILRKLFTAFLTNRVLKAKDEEVLKIHASTKDRDYKELYGRIFGKGDSSTKNFGLKNSSHKKFRSCKSNPTHPPETPSAFGNNSQDQNFSLSKGSVMDLGCGVNGFSYKFFGKEIVYVGIEAVGQVVKMNNDYFKDRGFEKAHVMHRDLFDLDFILDVLKKMGGNSLTHKKFRSCKSNPTHPPETPSAFGNNSQDQNFSPPNLKPRVVFMFGIIDALEFLERHFSKKFISEILENCEKIVLSFPMKSLSGKGLKVKRFWMMSFIEKNFQIIDSFETRNEKFIIFKK